MVLKQTPRPGVVHIALKLRWPRRSFCEAAHPVKAGLSVGLSLFFCCRAALWPVQLVPRRGAAQPSVRALA